MLPLTITAQEEHSEYAVAARYTAWALTAVNDGRNEDAKTFLLRAADYASVSSDLSYLLALVHNRLGGSANDVLAAIALSIQTDRWDIFSRNDAILLEARTLITIKRYTQALRSLSLLGDEESAVELRLLALKGAPNVEGFRKMMSDALNRYPRNTAFLRILFNYAQGLSIPRDADRRLIDIAIKRMPSVLQSDPDLAYMAAPFMSDIDAARLLLLNWRASRQAPVPIESLPVSLSMGIINESVAMEELFRPSIAPAARIIDKNVLTKVYNLLRNDDLRAQFLQDLIIFSGTITEDTDSDGIPETKTTYSYGLVNSWECNASQDGVSKFFVTFNSGDPMSAEITALDDGQVSKKIFIAYEKYPSVFEAIEGDYHYYFPPEDFHYPILLFDDLCDAGGLLYPQKNNLTADIQSNTLFGSAYLIERPSEEFSGAVERFECFSGVINGAKTYLNGAVISSTEYKNGSPVVQNVDLDLNGTLETRRFFGVEHNGEAVVERIESDWDGDGIFEYSE
ncbi:MAG: hypothetical protein Ta2F_09610 [Termitinemataceae bacterium]|nr:MAG: hypothetical protein Ta2F_09610 [Termitinemataceae bacterium]